MSNLLNLLKISLVGVQQFAVALFDRQFDIPQMSSAIRPVPWLMNGTWLRNQLGLPLALSHSSSTQPSLCYFPIHVTCQCQSLLLAAGLDVSFLRLCHQLDHAAQLHAPTSQVLVKQEPLGPKLPKLHQLHQHVRWRHLPLELSTH